MAACLSAVFLLGVPRWRPPRLSPGFDPLGIAIFRRPYYLGRSNPLHVTLRCPVEEAQNRSLKRIGISALVIFQEPLRYLLRVTEYERTAGPAAVAYDGGAYARPR
jgi:hypothetical protein